MLISVIIPCFNEEKVLNHTYGRLSKVLSRQEGIEYELVFIDDGSTDGTQAVLTELAQKDLRVNLIRFSRNFGHQPAVSAGIKYCRGDLAVIIDADLQDPPEVIPDMIQQLMATGSNVVYGVRKKRKGETIFKRATAHLFYLVLNKLSEVPLPVNTGDFRVIDRKIINAFNNLQENNKYIRGLISWVGFKQTPFSYERDPRCAGSTKYSLKKMLRFASTGIFYFSKKPLQVATTFGFLSVVGGLLLSLWLVFNKILNPQYLVSGWTSLVLVVIYFGGVQLLTIGILGHYIGSLFDEIKKRPEYIIDETTHLEYERAGDQGTERPAYAELQETLALAPESQSSRHTHPRQGSIGAPLSGRNSGKLLV
ncbi:MAG TPA: glycosyltransferase family 2 protein [Candidatus Acidoferrum sp.]|nr:glycosyltransferase family 2 protein [Candidatus Acidoferrum sp.]